MKNLFSVLMLIVFQMVHAQNISTASFRLLDADLTANTAGTIEIDQNGETAALIKVVTTQTGFTFDCGSIGIVKTIQKPSEIWVYVPRGAKKITISHPQLGLLRDYYFPVSINAARTYEMVLTTGMVETVVRQTANSQYLVLKVEPVNAIVELDNEILPTADGVAQKFVRLGTYEYRVQAPDYHTEAGKVTIDDPNNKKVVDIKLSPAFGWIEFQGNDELNGAQVFIDNALAGIIPMKSRNLASGPHDIKVVKPLYQSYSQTVIVADSQTTTITPQLKADFSIITINVANNADIYVNKEKKGTGTWTGKLGTGSYVLEAKKKGHRSTTKNVDISSMQPSKTIYLDAPIPIYGSVNITSNPSASDVYIDENLVGQTPLFIPEILSGTHQIVITHIDHENYVASINIAERENISVEAILDDKNLVEVSIECNVPDAVLYVDGKEYGKLSNLRKLLPGKHIIRLVAEGYEDKVDVFTVMSTGILTFNRHIVRMQPFKAKFRCDKTGIYVRIDNGDFQLWSNPNSLELSKGTHNITVRCKGYRELNDKILIEKGNEEFFISFENRNIINSRIDNEKYVKEKLNLNEQKKKQDKKYGKMKQTVNWEDIRITSNRADIQGLTYLGDVTEKYGIGGVFIRMKKKAAKMGARIILTSTPHEIHPKGLNFMEVSGAAYK